MALTYEELIGIQNKRKKREEQEQKATVASTKPYAKRLVSPADDIAPVKKFTPTTTTKTKPTVTTSAKKKENERTWFKKSSYFDDGYDFGDVTKTILGTVADVGENIGAGIVGMGEKALDSLMTLGTAMNKANTAQANFNMMSSPLALTKKGRELSSGLTAQSNAIQKETEKYASQFVAKDLYDEEQIAKKIISAPIKSLTGMDVESASVFGEKSDALVQSAGQLLATAGLQAVGVPWFLTTGATSFGAETEEALKEGATFEQATMSAVVSAGAEILSEKLSGGIKFGGKTLDDVLLKPLTEKITNKAAKTLVNLGVDAVGEGFEEIFSGVISNLGSALYKEESIGELLASEEAFDEYLESFIGGMVLGGVSSTAKAVADRNKIELSENEQKVFDKVVEERINEEKEGGTEVTKKKEAEIRNAVLRDMLKGYIDTDTIESVLGGETYKTYKDTVDNETALQEEFDTLNKMKQGEMTGEQLDRRAELKQQLEELKNNSKTSEMKTKLGEDVFNLVKDSRLSESYNERYRRGQTFDADLSKYDVKQQETIKKAIESGILNNTNRTHEFVDMVAKISADKGVLFDFVNNEKLKTSGFAVEGKTVNGYKTNEGNIAINIESSKALDSIVGHEITHILEGTELYTELQKAVKEYATTKGEYATRLQSLRKMYEGVYKGEDFDDKIRAELTADIVGEYLFTDADFVNRLSAEKPNVFKKIYDEIKYLCKIATAGSKEARELEKVKHQFEKAYRESAKNANTETQYSIREEAPPKKTKKAYKLMRFVDGKLYPLFIGNNEEVSVGTWYNADSPNISQLKNLAPGTHLVDMETGEAITWDEYAEKYVPKKNGKASRSKPNTDDIHWANENGYRFMHIEDKAGGKSESQMLKKYGDTRAYYNWGVNGSSKTKSGEGSASLYALRPGWHFGEVPSMHQIGYGGENGDTVRLDNQVWVEVEMSADVDYNAEAESNWSGDIPTHIPVDGYYKYATNPTQKKTKSGNTANDSQKADWYVAGAFKVNRIISDSEADSVVERFNKENGKNVPLDYRRNNGRVFNAETMQIEDSVKYSLSTEGMSESDIESAKKVIGNLKTNAMSSRYIDGYATYTKERMEREISNSSYSNQPDYAKSYITWVNPIDFLYATTTSEQYRNILKEEAGELDLEKLKNETQPIHLTVDFETGEIVGHEGRHRMIALGEKGVNKVAIVIDALNDNRSNTKPIEFMSLKGQQFAPYRQGTNFYLHNMLPLSQRYADTARELFTNKPASGIQYSLSEIDDEYMDAYYDGDDDAMQEIIDRVAHQQGYKYKAYHHTENGFTVFDLNKARSSMDIQGFFFSADKDAESEYGSVRYDTYLKMDNPYIVDSKEKQNAIPFDMSRNNAGVIAREWLQSQGYDSVIRKAEYFGAEADEYIVFDSSQIKSAEPMTFADDEYGEGDVIPPSERFNENNPDIRYSLTDNKYLSAVESGDSETAQRMVDDSAKLNGYTRRMFHETDAKNIHIFDTSLGTHGATDSETPYGIFTKSSAKNIGLGSRQMALYVKADNTLYVEDRADVKNKIPEMIPYFDEISRIDREYDALAEETEDAEFDALMEWMNENPDADMEVVYPTQYIIDNRPADIDSQEYLDAFNEHLRIMEEWRSEYNKVAVKCKELITSYLRSNGYDSMYFEVDGGSRGRQTDSLILLDPNQVKSADTVTYDDNGNVIPLSERFNAKNNDIRYSISTEKIPQAKTKKTTKPTNSNLQKDMWSVRDVRNKTMLENGYTQSDVDQVNGFMDNLATYMEKAGVTYRFIGLEDVNNAKVKVIYDRDGTPKRITMSAMVKNGEYPVNFDFTTICKKRQSMSMVIEELARRKNGDGVRSLDEIDLDAKALWTINEELRKAGLETACLGCFVESKRYNIQNFANKATTMWNSIVDEIRQEQGKTEPVESFNFAEGVDLDKVNYSKVDKIFKAYRDVKGRTSPEKRMRALIQNGGEVYQKHLQPSDLMTPEGIEGLKSLSTNKNDFYGIIKGVYGQAAPKEVMSFTPYNSEIALLPDKKGKNMKMAEYIAKTGGVRMQSFSDFIVSNVYDYMQMVADLSAKHLPAHAYTKEIAFAKIFGKTGIKINMSVMFDIDPSLPGEYAGLQFVPDANGSEEYNGVKGRFEYLVADKARSEKVLAETGERPYVQSIGFDEAVELQNTEGYSGNIGIIGVGYSDKHIRKMLNDNNIRYVIPYHSSSLPTEIKNVTNISKATDYTEDQNTRTKNGDALPGLGGFDIYKDVAKTKNPKKTAQNYLDYCKSKDYTPVFSQFADEVNYYKLLFDFDPYDTITGEYSPQTEVKNIYEGYNPAEGLTSTEAIEKLIDEEMRVQNEANRERNAKISDVVDSVLEQLGIENNKVDFSIASDDSTPSKYGRFFAKDILYRGKEDIAPVSPVSETEQVESAVNEADYAPMTEAEANAMWEEQKGSIDTLTDADMPPEIEAPIYSADTTSLDKKTLSNIANTVKDTLSLSKAETKALQDIIQRYSTSEQQNEDDLFEEIKAQFGEKSWEEKITEIAQVKQVLRGCRINVSPTIKRDIPDYAQFRKRNFGKILFANDGMDVDKVYMTLSDHYPSLFPDSIGNATDQLLQIAEVANMDAKKIQTDMLSDETIREATELMTDVVNTYKEKTLLKDTEAQGKEFLKNAKKYESEMPVFGDDFAPVKAEKEVAPAKYSDDVKNLLSKSPRYKTYEAKVNENLQAQKAALREEYNKKAEELQEIKDLVKDKNAFISDKALSLYKELSGLRKGVRASEDLAYFLDLGFNWSELKSTFLKVSRWSDRVLNPESDVESAVREAILNDYESMLDYGEGDIEAEYNQKVQQLEAKAQRKLEGFVEFLVKQSEESREKEKILGESQIGTKAPTKKKGNTWSDFVRNFVSKGAVFETTALKNNNRALEEKYKMWKDRSESKAQYFMENGEGNIPSLKSIVDKVKDAGLYNEFDLYMKHRHNMSRVEFDKPIFGYDVTAEMSLREARKLQSQHPEFKEWAKEVYKYNDYLLQKTVDGGLISQEFADELSIKYPNYVPVERILDEAGQQNFKRVLVGSPIKTATGGETETENILKALAHRTEQVFKAVDKNAFGVELMNTIGGNAEVMGANTDDVLNGLPEMDNGLLQPGVDGKNPTFTVFENGERVTFEISEEMYKALQPTTEAMSREHKLFSVPSKLHKKVLTEYNLFFTARNFPKDVQEVIINSKHPAKTYANMPVAVKELLKGEGKYVTEYWKNGGKSNTYFEGKENDFIKDDGAVKKVIGFVPNGISKVNDFVEAIPRLAEYIASRKNGASIEGAMLDAARVTTDFSDGGDITKFLNRNGFTFLNASVQGASQQVRNIRQAKAEGFKGIAKLVGKYAISGLPVLLFNHLMWDDDEEYEELSEYVKDNYYVIAKYGDGQFVRIPKGRTAAVLQEVAEQAYGILTGEVTGWDGVKDSGKAVYESFMNNIAPSNPIENNVIAPIIQTAKNKTWYGEDLVPTRLQDLPAREQYDEATDSISKWLGEHTGISPYKINYLLNQYSGFIGDMVLPAYTPEAERGDNSFLGNMIAPLKDQFVVDAVIKNRNPSDFYSLKDELNVNANSKDATDKDKLMYKYIESVGYEMGDLYKQKREVQNSNLSDDLKFKQVRDIQEQINAIAKHALYNYDNVKVDKKHARVGGVQYSLNNEGEWQKLTDEQIDKQNEVIGILGITPGQYWSNKQEYDIKALEPDLYKALQIEGISVKDYKENYEDWMSFRNDDFSWAANNPEKHTVARLVSGNAPDFRDITAELWDIKGTPDGEGGTVYGSEKKNRTEFIFNLDIEEGAKYLLFKSEYKNDHTYNKEVIDYVYSRSDITDDERKALLEWLKFTVGNDGYIYWD